MRDKITLFELPDNDDRGVSPVIGVILMVAITVILAAVIASFVLGFGDSVNENVQAGASVDSTLGDSGATNGEATVTWVSEGTASEVQVSVTGTDSGNVDVSGSPLSGVGESATITENTAGDNTVTVVVTAVGEEGTKTVVTQKEITI